MALAMRSRDRDGVPRRQQRPSRRAVSPLPKPGIASRHPAELRHPARNVVQALPRPQAPPRWLMMLLTLQRTSSALTLLLIVALLAVYGWTVYTQQRWGRAYSHLEALQKQERQLTAANEVLKNQMAQQAEAPDVGLMLPDPGNTIFLTPAPQRPPVEPEINLPPPQPIPARPLGY